MCQGITACNDIFDFGDISLVYVDGTLTAREIDLWCNESGVRETQNSQEVVEAFSRRPQRSEKICTAFSVEGILGHYRSICIILRDLV